MLKYKKSFGGVGLFYFFEVGLKCGLGDFIMYYFNDLFRSRDFHSVFTSMVDAFSSCKDVQSATGQEKKHGYNHGDFYCTWPINFFLQ